MFKKTIAILILISLFSVSGCCKKTPEPNAPAVDQKTNAAEEINEENMAEELEKLEKEIESDTEM